VRIGFLVAALVAAVVIPAGLLLDRDGEGAAKAFAVAASHDTGNSNMHSAPVRVYDRDGRWRSKLHSGVDLTPANLAHDLRAASG
jgi:hypothetical protein